MALTTTFIEKNPMGHYSHLSIEEREDIMVCWKNHESISLTEDVGYMFSTIKKGSTGVITQVSNWSWAAKANVDGKEIDLREGTYEIL